jgi:3'(2'), 5'-bisphosphate nucleotidase
MSINLDRVSQIAKDAGKVIIDIYNNPEFSSVVDFKADNSPLTLADKASNDVIVHALTREYPDIPVLSEEGVEVDYSTRSAWNQYWLIDPLDGTKEFINRNGEFTVNIALIENTVPVAGIVYVPVEDILYRGSTEGAFKITREGMSQIHVSNNKKERVAVRSKSHASPEEDVLYKEYDIVKFVSVGSSLKFCMVAEGKADLYFRHGPTMEWDTGAGQAVLEASGGRVYHGNTTEKEFRYNKENLLNGSFLCLGF